MLHQPLGLFDDHFGYLNMPFSRFVERRTYYFRINRSLHVCNLFRSLVDQQNERHNILVAGNNGIGNCLQQHRFTGSRRGYDQPPLTKSDGYHQIHDAGGKIIGIDFKIDFAFGIKGGEVIEKDLVSGHFGVLVIDSLDFQKCEISFRFLRLPNLPRNSIAGP